MQTIKIRYTQKKYNVMPLELQLKILKAAKLYHIQSKFYLGICESISAVIADKFPVAYDYLQFRLIAEVFKYCDFNKAAKFSTRTINDRYMGYWFWNNDEGARERTAYFNWMIEETRKDIKQNKVKQ